MSTQHVNWGTASAPHARALSAPQLSAYFERISVSESDVRALDSASLLHLIVRCHSLSIPFEALDVALGVHVSLDPAHIFSKLVVARRGGYCLENSFLLFAALSTLGFQLRIRAARVWMRVRTYVPQDPPMARQHVVLLVKAPEGRGGGGGCETGADGADGDGMTWLVDVGFGGGGPSAPLPLREGQVRACGDIFELRAGNELDGEDSWLLYAVHDGAWKLLYSFEHYTWNRPRCHAADFILTNFFVQHAAGSIFHTIRVAAQQLADGRVTLINNVLRVRGCETLGETPATETRTCADADELREVALQYFRIELSPAQAVTVFALGAANAIPPNGT